MNLSILCVYAPPIPAKMLALCYYLAKLFPQSYFVSNGDYYFISCLSQRTIKYNS